MEALQASALPLGYATEMPAIMAQKAPIRQELSQKALKEKL